MLSSQVSCKYSSRLILLSTHVDHLFSFFIRSQGYVLAVFISVLDAGFFIYFSASISLSGELTTGVFDQNCH